MNRQLVNAIRLACLAGAVLAAPVMAQQTQTHEQPSKESSSDAPKQMSKIKVEDAVIDDASSEGLGYAANAATLGKDVRSLREIPHSVTIVTRDQLTDMNITTVEGALKNVTGVTLQRYDATGSYTEFIARGFAADTYLLDGLTVPTDSNGIYFDLAGYDRIEVQRGAASIFSGAGEPGVTVNMARKRASADFQADSSLGISSWDDYRLEMDIGSALNRSGTLRARAVGVMQNFDTFMDGIDDNSKYMLYGTLEQDLGDRTTVAVGVTWQAVDTVLSRGLPAWSDGRLIDMRRSTMPVMDWNEQELDSLSGFAELEHRADDGALLKLALRYLNRTNDANAIDPAIPLPNGDMTMRGGFAFEREDTDRSADLYYSKPLEFGGQTHNLLVGADYRVTQKHNFRYTATPPAFGIVNIFAVDHAAIAEPRFAPGSVTQDDGITSYGAYTQLRYKPADRWTLIGGGRLSWWRSDGMVATNDYEVDSELTPYLAMIVDVSDSISLYGSYNEVFKPQNARTIDGDLIEPRVGEQFEVGIKGEVADGRLTYSAAVYRLSDVNRAIADPANPEYSIAAGKARSHGLDIDVRGQISAAWAITAGYAFNESEYVRAGPNEQGKTISTVTPKHSGNLWVHYTAPGSFVRGLELSVGMRAVGKFYNNFDTPVYAPGYAVFAVGGSYAITPRYSLAINIDNVLDKRYWEKVSYPGRQNFFGEPRRFTISLRVAM